MSRNVFLLTLISALGSATPASGEPSAADVPGDGGWAMYNKGYDGQRYSPLTQIDKHSAATLKRVCAAGLGDDGAFQSGPVVVKDTLYVTTIHTTVALDAATCELRWRHVYQPEQDEVLAMNRGLAVAENRVLRGTADGRIIALDSASGEQLWKVKGADPTVGEFFSSAPIVWNKRLFIGIAGSDWGARGRMMAYDIASGKEVWRWYSIPMGTEKGAETWTPRAAAARGGGGFWTSYALDPVKGELFLPVANPSPDYNVQHGVREGANLYTDSLVVLDAASGRLKWYHQFDANDPWDYDVGAAPMLFPGPNGARRVAVASKDGNLYALDRDSHKLVFRTAVTTVWDHTGKRPTPEGTKMCPGALGGTEWNGPALDIKNNAIVVAANDICMIYKSADPTYRKGAGYYAGTVDVAGDVYAWVTSVDSTDGKIRWHYKAAAPVVAGVTPTAGGITFAGDLQGNFLVFDSETGVPLFQQKLDGGIGGGIITYTVAGKQYVAVTSGNMSRWTFKTAGTPQLVIYGLGLSTDAPKLVTVGERHLALNISTVAATGPVAHGKELYQRNCVVCHGGAGEGGVGPSLIGIGVVGFETIVDRIKNPLPKMPKLPLDDREIHDTAEYVQTLK